MNSSIKMRQSRVLDKLRSGETVCCIKMNLADSRAFEIAAMAGFDCVWTDMEHVANDWSVIERQILASKIHNTDIMVRVARGGYSDYVRPLELDATGIMVPHVMSAEDAKKVVKMTKFHPVGRRPLDGGNADGAYCGIELLDYIKEANEKRFITVQIEDPEPMNELEEIASVEGIDMLFFGPGDFSQGIGAPGIWDDPRLVEARKNVAEAALNAGKFAATVGSPDNMKELEKEGYRFISMGADVVGLSQYFSNIVTRFRGEKKNTAKSIYKGGDDK
jgi:4-hydroxy-2-oxoheptanedioate aldolase